MAAKKLLVSIDNMYTIQSMSDNQFMFLDNYHKYKILKKKERANARMAGFNPTPD